MKSMILPAIGFIIIATIAVVLLVDVIKNSFNGIKEIDQAYKDLVGVQVVYKEDTLMIVDYKLLDETLILDNGLSINNELLKTLPTIPKEE